MLFYLWMYLPSDSSTASIELVMKDGRSEKIVMLRWDIKGDGKGVVIVYQRTDQERRRG